MIDKGTISSYFFEKFLLIAAGGVGIQILANFNPIHAVLGAVGQILILVGMYVRNIKKGQEVAKKPLLYWFACIFLGAALGYLFTIWMSHSLGWNEVACSILLGVTAQSLADIGDVIIEVIKKKIGNYE